MPDTTTKESQAPHHIFDRIFKRLMHLSNRAVITFINALFGTNHPISASLEYLSTEHIADNLEQWIGDGLIRVDKYKYCFEVQMADDKEMSFRIWNYSYLEGLKDKKTEDDVTDITLVPAIVIYLEPTPSMPDRLTIRIKDMEGEIHIFKYPVLKLLDYSVIELEQRKLVLLLPFYLLKLRKRVKAEKNLLEVSKELKHLIEELVFCNIQTG